MRRTYAFCSDIYTYLHLPNVQQTLGVDPAHPNFTSINFELNARFGQAGDYHSFAAEDYLAALLERGSRVLIYVGASDWICNWVRLEDADTSPQDAGSFSATSAHTLCCRLETNR